jgi:tyrosyl-tRNA synthetase
MSISDEMMWRYYELLTDVQVADIDKIKRESHPMQAKKDLARRIVADFHSAEAAGKAGEDWARQFQKDQVPDLIETIGIRLGDVGEHSPLGSSIKVDKLLFKAGFASSVTEAGNKRKAGSVRFNTEIVKDPVYLAGVPPFTIDVRLGHRIKRVQILP